VWAIADLIISNRELVASTANTQASHLNLNFSNITVSKTPNIRQKQNILRFVIFLKKLEGSYSSNILYHNTVG
jgi:hypothetical protein